MPGLLSLLLLLDGTATPANRWLMYSPNPPSFNTRGTALKYLAVVFSPRPHLLGQAIRWRYAQWRKDFATRDGGQN